MTRSLSAILLRPFFAALVVALFCTPTNAEQPGEQERPIEDLFTERIYNCYEIALNSSILIVRLYGEAKLDSVRLITDY